LGDFDKKWTSLKPLIFLTLTLPDFFRKGRFKGCYLPLKYDTDGAAISAFHLTNKEIRFHSYGTIVNPFVAQIKVMRGTFICAQIEVYEYTNRIFSVNVEHYSHTSYTYYRIPPPLAVAAASVAASATVGAAATAISAAAVAVAVDAVASAAVLSLRLSG
jgi:hypothetical protein